MEGAEVKRISPEKAIELLRDDGVEVTIEQAKVILKFMYQIAEIVIDQYLSNPELI
jgi:5'-3' exonuclease